MVDNCPWLKATWKDQKQEIVSIYVLYIYASIVLLRMLCIYVYKHINTYIYIFTHIESHTWMNDSFKRSNTSYYQITSFDNIMIYLYVYIYMVVSNFNMGSHMIIIHRWMFPQKTSSRRRAWRLVFQSSEASMRCQSDFSRQFPGRFFAMEKMGIYNINLLETMVCIYIT